MQNQSRHSSTVPKGHILLPTPRDNSNQHLQLAVDNPPRQSRLCKRPCGASGLALHTLCTASLQRTRRWDASGPTHTAHGLH